MHGFLTNVFVTAYDIKHTINHLIQFRGNIFFLSCISFNRVIDLLFIVLLFLTSNIIGCHKMKLMKCHICFLTPMDMFNNINHPLFYTDFDKSYYRYKIVGTDIKYSNCKDIYKLWISVKSFIDIYN